VTFKMKHWWELPPLDLPVPDRLEDAIDCCATGEASPDIALMQLLIVSPSQEQAERMLGSAIWDALENRECGTAERLGAIQKLWDGAKGLVQTAFQDIGQVAP
jgi:hypothetical protein